MGMGYIDDLATAAFKKEMPAAERKAAKKIFKRGGKGPLRMGKARRGSLPGNIAPGARPARRSALPGHPMTGAPRTPKGAGPMHGPVRPPMPSPHYFNPPKPKTGYSRYAQQASQWAKGNKKIIAGGGAVALAGTAFSNNTGVGSSKGSPNQARGMYGF